MNWSPERYLQFDDLRLRPALDLLARIAAEAPATLADLGCGPGNVTRLLAQRWPAAEVLAVDRSAAMLARAAEHAGEEGEAARLRWIHADLAAWEPERALDLVFSNAALHWLDDHPALFARLAGMLAKEGVLAVQMPANFDAPSHRAICELAAAPAWQARLGAARMGAVLDASDYWRVLSALFHSVELWETVYWQRLVGEEPVLDWLRGTTLVPYLALLDEGAGARFVAALKSRLETVYPREGDGSVLYPFRRLFMIGRGPR